MYCPNCTTEISTEHKYCRACGVDLREISLALGGSKHLDRPVVEKHAEPERSRSAGIRVWRRGFYVGMLGLVLVWEIPRLGSVLILMAICLMVSSYFMHDKSPKSRHSPTTPKAPRPELPVPSVTERTTKLFDGHRSEESRTGSRSDA
jgi:hypothetical protein